MSQTIVLSLLEELGGNASVRELKDLALIKYPDGVLAANISNKLSKLRTWGLVDCDGTDSRDRRWRILGQKEKPQSEKYECEQCGKHTFLSKSGLMMHVARLHS